MVLHEIKKRIMKVTLTNLLFIFTLLCSGNIINAQVTITLQPDGDDGKDALIHGLSSEINVNYGSNPQFSATAWTFQGVSGTVRSALEFDLSSIPPGSIIDEARLSLYAWDLDEGMGKHSTLSGSNASILQRITSAWNESTIDWTSHPETTSLNQVEIEQTTNEDQNFEDIDVTLLVRDMMAEPNESFGFLLRLQNETFYRRVNFASSDHSNSELHPKLVITYSPPIVSDTCVIIRPGSEAGKDAILHGLLSEVNKNYGHNPQFLASTWTFQGVLGSVRSIVDFDLSELPEDLIINSARLSLYAWDSDEGFGQHSNVSGSNSSWLKRVTSEWDENTVTWTNKPSTTEMNKVEIPATSSPDQNFLDINVSYLVQDYFDQPNSSFGFQMELNNESAYRLMNFASSDHENSNLHPQLKVCYDFTSNIYEHIPLDVKFNIYPNPGNNFININLSNNLDEISQFDVTIIDANGKNVFNDSDLLPSSQIDISTLPQGVYFVEIISNSKRSIQKLIVHR